VLISCQGHAAAEAEMNLDDGPEQEDDRDQDTHPIDVLGEAIRLGIESVLGVSRRLHGIRSCQEINCLPLLTLYCDKSREIFE
jgi:hypothetical protein